MYFNPPGGNLSWWPPVLYKLYMYDPEKKRGDWIICNGYRECLGVLTDMELSFLWASGGYCVTLEDSRKERVVLCESNDGEKKIMGFIRMDALKASIPGVS